MDTSHFTLIARFDASRRWLVRLSFACVLYGFMAVATAQEPSESAEPEGLEFASASGDWVRAVALDTDVQFRIRGLLAEVTVEQTYRNDTDQFLEGRYLLPLPETAAVHALELRIGDRHVVGEVHEKAQAQALHQAAAASGKASGLVEQNRPNLFRTRVANIPPHGEVKIRIGYWQRVDFRDGEFSISLPLTLTPRYANAARSALAAAHADAESLPASPAVASDARGLEPTVALRVDLVAGVPLESVASASHAIDVQTSGDARIVTLRDSVVRSDRDFELHWRPQPAAEPQNALFVEHLADADYVLAMLMPPVGTPTAPLPREMILVIDTSGSMGGESIRQARQALTEALTHLRSGDRFNLIQFNSVTTKWLAESVPADAAHLHEARQWIDALVATAGTEVSPAITAAFAGTPPAGYVRQVVFATDAAIGNEVDVIAQIEREIGEARLFPVGIGSAPNGSFLRKAAEVGRGSEIVIRNPGEVVTRMNQLFGRLDRPLLRDVHMQWPASAEAYPRRLPDLYAGEPLLSVARLARAQGTLEASGWQSDRRWSRTLDLGHATVSAGGARLWGRSKIDAFEDDIRLGAPEDSIRPQIVALAIEHGLVSRFTSLVAVDKTPARPTDQALHGVAFDNALPDGSVALAQGSTDAALKLAAALALLVLAFVLSGSRRHRGVLT